MGHLDNELRDLHPNRALLVDGRGKRVAIVPWDGKSPRNLDPGPWANWIREKRLAANMTQAQLGEACDVGVRAAEHWEQGSGPPGKTSRAKLDELFGEGPWHE